MNIIQYIYSLPIQSGDVLWLASDFTSLLMKNRKNKNFLNNIIDTFQEILGENGTLLIPTFNWEICNGVPYNYNQSKSQTGSLSNLALKRDDFKRTKHPIYSFAVWGKEKNTFFDLTNISSFSTNSPFALLDKLEAKMLIINLDYNNSFTYVHYVEELLKVPYRHPKTFTADTQSGDSMSCEMMVRDLSLGVETSINQIGFELEKNGLSINSSFENTSFIFINNISKTNEIISNDIKYNNGKKLYTRKIQMLELMEKLYPLHRTLNSDDMDTAYNLIYDQLPKFNNTIHEYQPDSKAWSWKIPKKYNVKHAILKDEDGNVYADFSKNPLYIWSYSISIKKEITFNELNEHLYFSEVRPDAIPWRFKFYAQTWGFCLPYNVYKDMPKDKKYFVDIDSTFKDEPFKVLTSYIDYEKKKDFLFVTNLCHPSQVNDSISGLVVANELLKRLYLNPIDKATHNVNFLFCPETIGTTSYLANNEEKIPTTTGGLFVEMVGHKDDENFILQTSIDSRDEINQILEYVLKKNKKPYTLRPFERWNDEGILNSYGVDISSPYLMKGEYKDGVTDFYKEYHTSDDNPSIISEEKLIETADTLEDFLRVYCSNYIPVQKERDNILFWYWYAHRYIRKQRALFKT